MRLFAILAALALALWCSTDRLRDAFVTHASETASSVVLITVPQANASVSTHERELVTHLVGRLARLGARLIVLAGECAAGAEAPVDDALAAAVARAGCVIATAPSYDALRRAARASGALRVRPDADGVVRRIPLDGERPLLAAVAAGVHDTGAPLFRRVPRVPTVPLMAALLDLNEGAVRAQVAGRIAVIELARPERRWPIVPGGLPLGAGWLTAAWIELYSLRQTGAP